MTSELGFPDMDRLLDAGAFGPLHLQRPDVAEVVRDSILHGAVVDYEQHAWVIMPNHVHMLLTPHTDVNDFLPWLKEYSARRANRLLGRPGELFWHEDSYEYPVRSDEEFRRIAAYILDNPLSAGLVNAAETFPWSSAPSAPAVEALV
jgi:putative transposase